MNAIDRWRIDFVFVPTAMEQIQVGILTVSDSCSAGQSEDISGKNLAEFVDGRFGKAGIKTARRWICLKQVRMLQQKFAKKFLVLTDFNLRIKMDIWMKHLWQFSGWNIARRSCVPDDVIKIKEVLLKWVDDEKLQVIEMQQVMLIGIIWIPFKSIRHIQTTAVVSVKKF